MNLVTYNIQYGLGADGRYDLARIAGEVAGADVIALQEVDRFWQRSGMVDGPEVLADALPRHHWVYWANLDMDASQDDGTRVISRRKQFGTMILSRWPILSSRNHLLPKWGDRLHHSIQQGMLEAVIATPSVPSGSIPPTSVIWAPPRACRRWRRSAPSWPVRPPRGRLVRRSSRS